jgi:excinuclease UvrABC helicase subunit UvrB
MFNEFDKLFNEFFNRNSVKTELEKVIKAIKKFKEINSDEELENEIENELGEPHSVETYEEDGLYFTKYMWHTSHGTFVKLIASDEPNVNLTTGKNKVKSLEEKLEEAIEAEDYLLAAKLRDQINAVVPKKRGRPKKSF